VVALVVLTMFVVPVSPSVVDRGRCEPATIMASLRPLHVLRVTPVVASNVCFFAELVAQRSTRCGRARYGSSGRIGVSGSDVTPLVLTTKEVLVGTHTRLPGSGVGMKGPSARPCAVQGRWRMVVSSSLSPAWSDVSGDLPKRRLGRRIW